MGQILHGSAKTTHAVRAAIQRSKASIQELASRYDLNPKTVMKWRKRAFLYDAPMGPKVPRSTVLSAEEEALAVAFREGRNEPAEIVAKLVRLKVDIVVTYGTPSILVAKQATSTIPIVFAAVGDPVRTGIVASLAWPGGNASGLSLQKVDLADKRLELLREVVPGFRRLAIMANIEPHARRQGSC